MCSLCPFFQVSNNYCTLFQTKACQVLEGKSYAFVEEKYAKEDISINFHFSSWKYSTRSESASQSNYNLIIGSIANVFFRKSIFSSRHEVLNNKISHDVLTSLRRMYNKKNTQTHFKYSKFPKPSEMEGTLHKFISNLSLNLAIKWSWILKANVKVIKGRKTFCCLTSTFSWLDIFESTWLI